MPSLAVHRSRSRIPEFRLLQPRGLSEALEMQARDPGIGVLAGGLDFVNRMKEGSGPATVMMLAGVAELATIGHLVAEDAIEIGAMARHDDLASSPLVRGLLPDLVACWDRIANIRIRMQGTVGGNLLARNPSYEGAVLLAALGVSLQYGRGGAVSDLAIARLHGSGGDAGFDGLATAIRVPLPPSGCVRRLVYDRSLRPALSIALCLDLSGDEAVSARAALGGCHAWPVVCDLPVQGMTASRLAAAAGEIAGQVSRAFPPPTVRWFGVPGYRERVAPVVLARLLREVAR